MNKRKTESTTQPLEGDFVGLFPAAGQARRLRNSQDGDARIVNTSKEILPVPDIENPGKTLAVGDYLVREFARAGIDDIVIIRRDTKTDIYEHYSHSRFTQQRIRHLVIEPTPSTAHTIDKAQHLFQDRPVALGFPDIILGKKGVFSVLCKTLTADADVCLGLFAANNPQQSDMVEIDNGNVVRIEVKPRRTDLCLTWSCAVWQPRFSTFLHQQVARYRGEKELYIGLIFQAALAAGMTISAVPFPQALSLDIGTPETLARANRL